MKRQLFERPHINCFTGDRFHQLCSSQNCATASPELEAVTKMYVSIWLAWKHDTRDDKEVEQAN